MSNSIMTFLNYPKIVFKPRDNIPSIIKGEDQKCCTLKINDLGSVNCKLVVKLLLKVPENMPHFYHLIRSSDNSHVPEVEMFIHSYDSVVTLDFFKIKKPLMKESKEFFKGMDRERSDRIYKMNCHRVILQICLVDVNTMAIYETIKYELGKGENDIVIMFYSPHYINNNEKEPLIFITEKEESDADALSLEFDFNRSVKCIPIKTKLKNVFTFPFERLSPERNLFKARLHRYATNVRSNWVKFKILENNIEFVKRKVPMNNESSPINKIPRQISSSISENLSQLDIYTPSTSFNVTSDKKQYLKNFFESKHFTSIARVGHDFACGAEVTKLTCDIAKKLPIVFTLRDDVGDTPLHNAILKNQEARATDILDIVHPNFPNELYSKNTSNHTALILSPACGVSPNFVQTLLDGFDMTDKGIDGNNSLCIAIRYKNSEILNKLVQNATSPTCGKPFEYPDIIPLIKQTILDGYFEGYEILMKSKLASDLSWNLTDPSVYDLDQEYLPVLIDFFNRLTLNTDVTPLPEITMDDIEEVLAIFET